MHLQSRQPCPLQICTRTCGSLLPRPLPRPSPQTPTVPWTSTTAPPQPLPPLFTRTPARIPGISPASHARPAARSTRPPPMAPHTRSGDLSRPPRLPRRLSRLLPTRRNGGHSGAYTLNSLCSINPTWSGRARTRPGAASTGGTSTATKTIPRARAVSSRAASLRTTLRTLAPASLRWSPQSLESDSGGSSVLQLLNLGLSLPGLLPLGLAKLPSRGSTTCSSRRTWSSARRSCSRSSTLLASTG